MEKKNIISNSQTFSNQRTALPQLRQRILNLFPPQDAQAIESFIISLQQKYGFLTHAIELYHQEHPYHRSPADYKTKVKIGQSQLEKTFETLRQQSPWKNILDDLFTHTPSYLQTILLRNIMEDSDDLLRFQTPLSSDFSSSITLDNTSFENQENIDALMIQAPTANNLVIKDLKISPQTIKITRQILNLCSNISQFTLTPTWLYFPPEIRNEFLNKLQSVVYLHLDFPSIHENDCLILNEIYSHFPNIKALNIGRQNHIKHRNSAKIQDMFSHFPNLKILDIQTQDIIDLKPEAIKQIFSTSPRLRALILYGFTFSVLSVDQIQAIFENLNQLKTISIDWEDFSEVSTYALDIIVKYFPTVERVNLTFYLKQDQLNHAHIQFLKKILQNKKYVQFENSSFRLSTDQYLQLGQALGEVGVLVLKNVDFDDLSNRSIINFFRPLSQVSKIYIDKTHSPMIQRITHQLPFLEKSVHYL